MSQDYKTDEKEAISHLEHVATQKEDLEDGHKRRKANNQLDEAAKILEERGEIEYTIEDSKRVLRKIDIFVCIVSTICLDGRHLE